MTFMKQLSLSAATIALLAAALKRKLVRADARRLRVLASEVAEGRIKRDTQNDRMSIILISADGDGD